MIFKVWEQSVAVLQDANKQWERQAASFWDKTLRHPRTLQNLGTVLTGVSTVKERTDRALEKWWEAWRLPSATDIERLYERMAELDEKLSRIDDRLAEQARREEIRPADKGEAA